MAVISLTDATLDDLLSTLPSGSLDKAILNNLRGFNHRQSDSNLPMSKKMPGYTFFVRPQLNLQMDNIRNHRKMSQLLNSNSLSMQAHIKTMLDPRLISGVNFKGFSYPAISCPITDNQQAFIPSLTNNCIGTSGWPSISVPTFKSKAGLYNESHVMVDGRVINDETFDITCNFRNTRGDPTLYMFYVWALYASLVFEGQLVPYFDYLCANWIDYNTRIYRITTDYRRKYVQEISSTRTAIPVGVPVGDLFNFSGSKPYLEGLQEIPITFSCTGFDVFDDIVIKEFNDTVQIFNVAMRPEFRSSYMVKLTDTLASAFHGLGYPWINTDTTELEWWVDVSTFNTIAAKLVNRPRVETSMEFTGTNV